MKSINLILTIIITFISLSVKAHFQLLLPDSDIIYNISKPLDFKAIFTHPMENGPIMSMGKPVRIGVISSNGEENLLPALKPFFLENKKLEISAYKWLLPIEKSQTLLNAKIIAFEPWEMPIKKGRNELLDSLRPVLRRVRDSNPRCLATYRLSRSAH